MRRTSLRSNLVWMLVPAAAYVALVPIPVLLEQGWNGLGQPVNPPSEDFWELVPFYGFMAAGFVGLFLISLLKRGSYERLAAAHGPVGQGGRTFWRLVSAQWRGESWFAFASTGLFGVLPLLWHDALAGQKPFDDSALAIMSSIAVACAIMAITIVLNAWRSGQPYGMAESVA